MSEDASFNVSSLPWRVERFLEAKDWELPLKTNYVWDELYEAAILETDYVRLPQRLQAAKAAIDDRLHNLLLDHGGTPEERLAISDALQGLNVLRRQLQTRLQATDLSNDSMPSTNT